MEMDEKMRKNALVNLAIVVGAGAFGSFCRWLQNQIAFDESGLSVSSPLNVIVILILLGMVIWVYFLTQKVAEANMKVPEDYHDAFFPEERISVSSAWVIGIIEVLGGLILAMTGLDNASPALTLIFALCAILSGILVPVCMRSAQTDVSNGTIALLTTVPILQFCIGLINCYKINATNPSVWVYSVQILAYACLAIAFYYIAGYAYGRVFHYRTLYFSMLGAFLSIMVIADDLNLGLVLIFLANGALLLLYMYMLMGSMEEQEEDPEKKENALKSRLLTQLQGRMRSKNVNEDEKVEEILHDYHEENK